MIQINMYYIQYTISSERAATQQFSFLEIKKGLDFSVKAIVYLCNFLSSSAGFNLCSCFFPAHPCLPLSFPTFSGPSIPRFSSLPFRFLTPSVSAFFRPLQFWVLTTQPLFFLSFSSRFRLTAAFPVPVSALASSVSPFFPT